MLKTLHSLGMLLFFVLACLAIVRSISLRSLRLMLFSPWSGHSCIY
jgi:hypothetical protein